MIKKLIKYYICVICNVIWRSLWILIFKVVCIKNYEKEKVEHGT